VALPRHCRRVEDALLDSFRVVAIEGCGSQRTADLHGSANTTFFGSVGMFAMPGEPATGAATAALATQPTAYSRASLFPHSHRHFSTANTNELWCWPFRSPNIFSA
jgi:hypothetical protein